MIPSSIKYKLDESGRKSGQACVQFQTKSDSLRALAERHKKSLGQRWIELIEIDQSEYENFNKTKDSYNIRCGDRVTDENVSRCVKLRGLPFTVTKQEVVEFFDGLKVAFDDVTLDV
jgi:RNA recognition motif-containing protein